MRPPPCPENRTFGPARPDCEVASAILPPVGNFRHCFEVLDPSGQRAAQVDAIVDTGSAYTWVPRAVLQGFGYRPAFQRKFKLADGSLSERDVVEALVRLEGQTLHTLCVFADPPAEPLLGAITLEAFALGVDPVQQNLIPVVLLAVGNLPVPE